jgi:CheY-like chemotaxis protein
MGRTILVVEDDRDFASQLTSMLEFDGFAVIAAATGPEALRAFADELIDLVLIDVMLPESHGLTVVGQLRHLPGGADVPVLVMSAVYGPGDLSDRDLLQLGVLQYLSKPFSLLELGRQVAALLAQPDGGRAAVRALQLRAGGSGDAGGLDIVTDSMTAVPDFLAEALASIDDDDDGGLVVEDGFDGFDGDDGLDHPDAADADDDEFDDAVVDVEYPEGADDAVVDVEDPLDDDEDDPAATTGFFLVAEPGEITHPPPPDPARDVPFEPAAADEIIIEDEAPPPPSGAEDGDEDEDDAAVVLGVDGADVSGAAEAAWAGAPSGHESDEAEVRWAEGDEDGGEALSSFEIDVEMERSGLFAVAEEEEEAPVVDARTLLRFVGGQPALPRGVATALLAAWRSGGTGRLSGQGERAPEHIVFEDGTAVWASAEPFEDGLPAWLVREGRLTAEQASRFVALRRARGWAVPRILRAIGRFEDDAVDDLLRAWVADRVAGSVAWTGSVVWEAGGGWLAEENERPVDLVQAVWLAVGRLRLGRVELDLAHLEGRTVSRGPDALRVLMRLPETSELVRLQAALAGPVAWTDLLPRAPEARDLALRILWVLDAAGVLDVAEEDPAEQVEAAAPETAASPAELRVRADWAAKRFQGPFEFLELPDVVDTQGVRAAYAALSKRWRLEPNVPLAHPESAEQAHALQKILRSAFQAALADLQDAD